MFPPPVTCSPALVLCLLVQPASSFIIWSHFRLSPSSDSFSKSLSSSLYNNSQTLSEIWLSNETLLHKGTISLRKENFPGFHCGAHLYSSLWQSTKAKHQGRFCLCKMCVLKKKLGLMQTKLSNPRFLLSKQKLSSVGHTFSPLQMLCIKETRW